MDIAVIVVAILLAMLVIAPRLAVSSSASRDVLDRILNYQGLVGLLALVFASVAFVWLITDWGWPALQMVFFTAALLVCVVGLFLLGFLLAYDLIRSRIFSSDGMDEPGDWLRALRKREARLGYLVLGVAVLALILRLL